MCVCERERGGRDRDTETDKETQKDRDKDRTVGESVGLLQCFAVLFYTRKMAVGERENLVEF